MVGDTKVLLAQCESWVEVPCYITSHVLTIKEDECWLEQHWWVEQVWRKEIKVVEIWEVVDDV